MFATPQIKEEKIYASGLTGNASGVLITSSWPFFPHKICVYKRIFIVHRRDQIGGSPGYGRDLEVYDPFHLDLSVLGLILISGVFIRTVQKHILQLEGVSYFLRTF